MRSDAPRRQPVWHAPSHCQRACPARCSQPAAAADQASAGSAYVPGSQPSPRCGVAARSRPPACPHPFVAGWASCCAGRAGHPRCRPPCTRCTRRSSCTRARSASDRRIASRRHAAAVDTCHRTHGHAWAPQPSACQAYRLPGRAALQASRPRISTDLHTLARTAYRVAPPRHRPGSKPPNLLTGQREGAALPRPAGGGVPCRHMARREETACARVVVH